MTWGNDLSYPKAIFHIDGDAFFASCEVAKNPRLRGKPIVIGKDRGIVSSASYEAKKLGIWRGTPLQDVLKICPEAVILPSDYETYALFSKRMYAIARRYTPLVEEYGVDECFGDLTGLRSLHKMSYEDMLRCIKRDLQDELDITFSVGLAPTKVLAKLGSKFNKPNGFSAIPLSGTRPYLEKTEIGKIWGIGPNTTAYLQGQGIYTALDFVQKPAWWVKERVAKPYVALWEELNGNPRLELVTQKKETYHSLQRTRTFTPTRNPTYLRSELSKNIEGACRRARKYKLAASGMTISLKTQEFRHVRAEIRLTRPTNLPHELIAIMEEKFPSIHRPGTMYRASGVTLWGLAGSEEMQLDLFGEAVSKEGAKNIYGKVDALAERFGNDMVYLASSFDAVQQHAKERKTPEKRMALPFLGEVG